MTIDKRYTIIKTKDEEKFLTETEKQILGFLVGKIRRGRESENRPGTISGVVVESDWPEYQDLVDRLIGRIEKNEYRAKLKAFLPVGWDPSLNYFYLLKKEDHDLSRYSVIATDAIKPQALKDYTGYTVQFLYNDRSSGEKFKTDFNFYSTFAEAIPLDIANAVQQGESLDFVIQQTLGKIWIS